MISDSPYQVGGQVLVVRAGIIFGVISTMIMLLLLAIIQPLSGFGLVDFLTHIGDIFVPISTFPNKLSLQVEVGFLIHLLLGALLGLLYAVCQQRIPSRGLLAVGIYYGFIIWVVDRFFITPFFNEYLRTILGSWSWLSACVLFGLSMAFASILMINRSRNGYATTMLKD
jgi:hypothetical protein